MKVAVISREDGTTDARVVQIDARPGRRRQTSRFAPAFVRHSDRDEQQANDEQRGHHHEHDEASVRIVEEAG
jgi:hypothetical protein